MIIQLLACLLLITSGDNTLEVKIQGIKEPKGMVRLAFYNSEEEYLDEEKIAFFHEELVIQTGEMTILIQLPKGDYSVAIYQDLNNDKELNTNLVGIPKEPYGFSNNVMGAFGPPSFEAAKVQFPTTNKITIYLR